MRAVGYKQIWSYLDGDFSLDEAIMRAQASTRQLAKRQITWLKNSIDASEVNAKNQNLISAISASCKKG
jgi:tRNA dimethylallyltransferase